MSSSSARRADPRAAAVRRADRRGRLDRERDPGLPLADRASGRSSTRCEYAIARGVPARPGARSGVLRAAVRDADRAPSRTPAHLALAELERLRARAGGRHAEHRPAARARGQPRRWSRCTARSAPRAAPAAARAYPLADVLAAARSGGRAGVPGLRGDAQAGRRLLRRAAAASRRSTARTSSRAARRSLLVVGSSLEVYPVAGLPLETLAAGGALAIVNRGPTAFDREAALKVDGAPARCCRRLWERVRLPRA